MYPVILDLGRIKIYSWGFMLALAVIISLWGLSRQFAKESYDTEIIFDIVFWVVVAGIIGARFAYVLVYRWEEFIANPLYLITFTNGAIDGLMWYGGFIGGWGAFIYYIKKKKLDLWKMLDLFAPFLALSYAIVRVGCFLNGCCFGIETDSVWGVVFPHVDHLHRYPTQLFSTAINLVIFGFLYWYYPRRSFNGEVCSLYLIFYAVYRFMIEFLRASEVVYGVLAPSQVISIFILLLGIGMYIWRRKVFNKTIIGNKG